MSTSFEDATKIYATHKIVLNSGDHWRLQRSDGGSEFWAEVVIGAAGTVIVHGDGPDMILRSWRWKSSAISLLKWITSSNLDYLATKVACGQAWDYDEVQAAKDFAEWINDQAEYGDETYNNAVERIFGDYVGTPPFKNAWVWQSGDEIHENEIEALREHIYDVTGDCESPDFGKVVSNDLQRVQAICQRLLDLLTAEIAASPA